MVAPNFLTTVQLPHDFPAPAPNAWAFNHVPRNGGPGALAVESANALARNMADMAESADFLCNQPGNDAIAAAAPALQCALRLVRLLRYFELVLNYFIDNLAVPPVAPAPSPWATRRQLMANIQLIDIAISNLPQAWDTNVFVRANTAAAQPNVPSEPVNELLGQLWIWMAAQRGLPTIRSPLGVQAYLRSMTLPFSTRGARFGNALDYQAEVLKSGLARCIFATQQKNAANVLDSQLLIGSTGAAFVDNPIATAFYTARNERLTYTGTNYERELYERWGRGLTFRENSTNVNRDVLTPVENAMKRSAAALGIPNNQLATVPNINFGRGTMCVTQLRAIKFRPRPAPPAPATDANWMPFDHRNQIAQSHFFMPGVIPFPPANPPVQFFEQVSRCRKCRVIYDYEVPAETVDVLNRPANCNDALSCAEDTAHAKLRTLYPLLPLLSPALPWHLDPATAPAVPPVPPPPPPVPVPAPVPAPNNP